MKNSTLRLLILILAIVLIVVVTYAIDIWLNQDHNTPSEPSTETSSSSSGILSSPPASTQTTTVPSQSTSSSPAQTPDGSGDYIGSLYTREQLEKISSKRNEYSTGLDFDSKNRPINTILLNEQYGKYDAYFIGPDDGKVYLTYNFTYEYEGLVQKTLNILKKKNVRCVVFIDKSFAQHHPHMIQQILDDGHILANHCTTHPDLPTLSIDNIVDEIMDIHNYVKETYGYEMKYFRPPSGYYSEQVWAIAQSLGYRSYNWSFAYRDWDTNNQPDPAIALQTITDALHSGAIYQLHAISSTNVAILEDFIDATRSAGFEFALLP